MIILMKYENAGYVVGIPIYIYIHSNTHTSLAAGFHDGGCTGHKSEVLPTILKPLRSRPDSRCFDIQRLEFARRMILIFSLKGRFPEMGLPNHPFLDGIFHSKF